MNKFDYKNFFKNKKITKQGFGVLGRGFGVVKFLLEAGAEVIVTDIKPKETFAAQIQELKKYEEEGKLKYFFGGHREEDFVNCDFVIAGSGVPKDNLYLNLAKKNEVAVYQESSLFVKLVKENFNNIKIIGITGTRGKTTTTFLIYELIKENLKQTKGTSEVYFGGNVQGVATLENLKKIKDGDYIVMELDSWVLQGFGDLKISPNISVFTSFMPDHMNYYKNDMKEYFEDKANIFVNQEEYDYFICTEKTESEIRKYLGEDYKVKLYLKNTEIFVPNLISKKYQTNLLGEHNQTLISLAEKVAEVLNIEKNIFDEVIKNFRGVSGRLELIKESNDVKIYNDTCATTPDAMIVALTSLKETLKNNSKIVLLCGGRDKELNLEYLVKKFEELQKENILEIFVLDDETTTGTKKLFEQIEKQNSQINFTSVKNLEEGIMVIEKFLHPGDIFLFSPGFASFGMFQNEYDRGDKFNLWVNKLLK